MVFFIAIQNHKILLLNMVQKLCDFGWEAYSRGNMRTTFCGTPFGRVPFPIWNQTDMSKIIDDPVYFPCWGEVSQKMIEMIKKMLIKNPKQRCSLNELLSTNILTSYLQTRSGVKNQIQLLF